MLAQRVRQSTDGLLSRGQKSPSESRTSRGHGTSHGRSWAAEDVRSQTERTSAPYSRPRSGSESFSRAESSLGSSSMSHSRSYQYPRGLTAAGNTANIGKYLICSAIVQFKMSGLCTDMRC